MQMMRAFIEYPNLNECRATVKECVKMTVIIQCRDESPQHEKSREHSVDWVEQYEAFERTVSIINDEYNMLNILSGPIDVLGHSPNSSPTASNDRFWRTLFFYYLQLILPYQIKTNITFCTYSKWKG